MASFFRPSRTRASRSSSHPSNSDRSSGLRAGRAGRQAAEAEDSGADGPIDPGVAERMRFLLSSNNRAVTGSQMVYAAVGRQRLKPKHTATISEAFDKSTPAIAVELGRRLIGRKPAPGWDDINCEGWRAVKLPVHDLFGCTSYVCVFGIDFDPKRAQATVERCALMLGPMLDGQLMEGEAPTPGVAELKAADDAQDQTQLLELHKVMEPILRREMEHANSSRRIDQIQDQLSDIKQIMQNNVEMILDRQDALEALEEKTSKLEEASKIFRKRTRTLRRWHLMNQVKWGLAVGTLVTVSVAIPVLLLAAV